MPLAEDPSAAAQPPRKRSRRLWLLAPYALVVLLLSGWSVGWFVVKGRIEQGLDEQAQALRGAGWTVALSDRRVSGFPFRLHLRYGQAQLAAPSGWAVTIPGLEGEAYLHAPDHWVLIAPHGLTFVRPKGGPVAVSGQALRVSLAGLSQPIWRVVLEGSKVAFAPSPDAQPFALASAELLQFYLQPSSKAGEGRWLLRVDNGAAAPNALLGALARGKPVASRAEGRLSRLDAWARSGSHGAAQAWSMSGGQIQLDGAELNAGAIRARLVQPSALSFDGEGRLVGALPLEVRPAIAALGGLAGVDIAPEVAARAAEVLGGRAAGDSARLTVTFQAGATTLGPVRIGPAPKLF